MMQPMSRAIRSAFAPLFEPARIGSVALRNRLVMLPMETNYATEDGRVTPRMIAYYRARAAHVGLVLVQITCVEPRQGKAYRCQLYIDDDRTVDGLRALAEVIHRQGARAFIQLHHAGANGRGDDIVAASALPLMPGRVVPAALDEDGIARIIGHYGDAAERARAAGFDGVEIVASGNYLVWNFLSATWNRRTDGYGGSLEHRARLLVEIIGEVRRRTGDGLAVSCRLACKDYAPESGFGVADARRVAEMAVEAGLDAITITAIGGDSIAPPHPGALLPLARAIKSAVAVPVTAAGRMDIAVAAEAVATGSADLAGFGRRLLADPDYLAKAASGADADVRPCIACKGCIDVTLLQNEPLRCGVNPECGREQDPPAPAAARKRVVVVGGGPAGMEAAAVAAERGHDVTLFDAHAALGGQLVEAARPPGKGTLAPLAAYLQRRIERSGAAVRVGNEAGPAAVEGLHPDIVIVAAGRREYIPPIPGAERAHAVTAREILLDTASAGLDVVVVGGELVGCETAEYLAERGRRVSIVEIRDRLLWRTRPMFRAPMLARLEQRGIRTYARVTRERYEANTMIVEIDGQDEVALPCDTIVWASGGVPNDSLAAALTGRVPALHVIGDAVEIGDIAAAIGQGFDIARAI